jgi:hypothetical protein
MNCMPLANAGKTSPLMPRRRHGLQFALRSISRPPHVHADKQTRGGISGQIDLAFYLLGIGPRFPEFTVDF